MEKPVENKLNAAESAAQIPRQPARHGKLWMKTLESSLVGTTEWISPPETHDPGMDATQAMGWVLAGIFFAALVLNSLKAKKQARGLSRSGDRDVLIYRPPRR